MVRDERMRQECEKCILCTLPLPFRKILLVCRVVYQSFIVSTVLTCPKYSSRKENDDVNFSMVFLYRKDLTVKEDEPSNITDEFEPEDG